MGSYHLTDPADIAAASFDSAFRGYDQDEVRKYLEAVAARLEQSLTKIDDLERELSQARSEPIERKPDASELTRWLGEETARVLDVANDAANAQRERAAVEADELLVEARARATELEADAEKHLADTMARANEEADAVVVAAEAQRSEIQEHYDAEIARANDEGERLIAEAKTVRAEMLEDLADERHEVRVQIEQLRAGRDSLMAVLESASSVVEGVHGNLEDAMPEARHAAEAARSRVHRQPVTKEEFEDHLDTSRTDDDEVTEPGSGIGVGELDREFGPAEDSDEELTSGDADIVALYDQTQYESDGDLAIADSAPAGLDDGDDSLSEPRLTIVGELDEEASDDVSVVADDVEPEGGDPTGATDDGGDPPDEEADAGLDQLFERLRTDSTDEEGPVDEVDEPDDDTNSVFAPPDTPIDLTAQDEEPADTEEETDTDVDAAPEVDAYELAVADLSRALKSELADEQNDLLDSLRQVGQDDVDYPDTDAQTERYLAAASTVTSEDAEAVVAALVAQLQRRVPPVLAESAADSEEMSDRVRSIYREMRTRRIEQAVREGLVRQPV